MAKYGVMVILIVVTGCASKLKVVDADKTTLLPGLPISSPVLVEVTTQTTYQIDPTLPRNHQDYALAQELCKPTTQQELRFLPLGDVKYVNYRPAWFAKSEFKVEYTDTGGTKSISVNSDPAATTEAASKLLDTVLPFLGKPQVAVEPAVIERDLDALRKKYCIVKSTHITLIKERQIDRK